MGLLCTDDIFYDQINDKRVIEEWIKSNYNIYGKLTISDDFIVDCTGEVDVNNKSITSLTNGMFRWGKVGTDFNCTYCDKLTSLEGAPKEVGCGFYCGCCSRLKSLEGAPEKVDDDFLCNQCDNLISLEGAPEKIGGDFVCKKCEKLTSLEGAPKEVRGYFSCSHCDKLETLAR